MKSSAPRQPSRAPGAPTPPGARSVGAGGLPTLDVFNKIDLVDAVSLETLKRAHPEALWVSAATRAGFDALVPAVEAQLALDQERVRLTLDDQRERDRQLLADLYRHGRVISQVNDRHRISVEADVPRRLLGRFARGRVPA